MKYYLNLFLLFFVLVSCAKKESGSASSGGGTTTTTVTNPNLCNDDHAANKGFSLPCSCNSGYAPNAQATACTVTSLPTNLAPANMFYNQNPITLYVDQAIGIPYTTSISNCTSTAPCTFTANPALPSGLTLNSLTGSITGFPTAIRALQSYQIKATNTYGNTTINLFIKVSQRPPSGLSIVTPIVVYKTGQAIVQNVLSYSSGAGSVSSMTASPSLPSGLAISLINAGTGTWAIIGTPTVSTASQDYVITATGPEGATTDLTVNIGVATPPTILTYSPNAKCSVISSYLTCVFDYGITFADIVPTFNGDNVKFRIASNSTNMVLPSGISLSSTTGKIVTTYLGPFETTDYLCSGSTYCLYKIEAYNALGSVFFDMKMKVNPTPPPTSFAYSQSSYLYRTLTNITDLFPTFVGGTANCLPDTSNCYSISPPLPSGLSISSVSGRITGAPDKIAKQAPVSYTVTARDNRAPGGIITGTAFTIEVKERLPIFSYTASGAYAFNKNQDTSSVGYPRIDTSFGIDTPSCGPNAIPITSFTVSPALPAGLTMSSQPFICGVIDPLPNQSNNGSGGIIYGIPSSLSPETTYTITGCNDGGCSTAQIKIEVSPYITKIAGGEKHACALTQDLVSSPKRVMCWGSNAYLQTEASSDICTQSDLSSIDCNKKAKYMKYQGINLLAIGLSAGKNHTCAIKDTGTSSVPNNTSVRVGKVICWGDNTNNQLGIGSTGGSFSSPQDVLKSDGSVLGSVTHVSSGLDDTCALADDNATSSPGSVYCWGKNYGSKAVRIGVIGTPDQAFYLSSLSVGENHACGVRVKYYYDNVNNANEYIVDSNDNISCWGLNDKGQLGNGLTSSTFTTTPNDVLVTNGSIATGFERSVVGGNHSCAYSATSMNCWGDNSSGQVTGLASTGSQYSNPQSINGIGGSGLMTKSSAMGAGYNYTLTQDVNNFTLLFGAFPLSVTNYPLLSNNPTQILLNLGSAGIIPFYSFGTPIIAPAAKDYACDTNNRNGLIYCWGKNNLGQLGNNSTVDSELPQKVIFDFN